MCRQAEEFPVNLFTILAYRLPLPHQPDSSLLGPLNSRSKTEIHVISEEKGRVFYQIYQICK